jgi:hypothetical protein
MNFDAVPGLCGNGVLPLSAKGAERQSFFLIALQMLETNDGVCRL